MSVRRRVTAVACLLVPVLVCGVVFLAMAKERQRDKDQGRPTTAPDLAAIRAAAIKIKPLHRPKGPPQPGDWLAEHEEPGQTFDQYIRSKPNRPTAKRTKIGRASCRERG